VEEEFEEVRSPLALARQYLQFRKGREALQKNEDTIKKTLMTVLEESGEADDKGNRFYYFPESVDGVQGVKRERRLSQSLDEDAAMELIEKHNLQNSCLENIVVLNEDGLLAANFDGIISDKEMASLYDEKESFAFILVKDK
jgi:hypothetical protein